MTTLHLFEIVGLLLGLLFGSFLNVCIARLPKGESIVTPRSRCPQCGHPIRWYDNIPLLSWLLLRGRCRDCKAAISSQYPLVELATGFWFATIIHLSWWIFFPDPAGRRGYGYDQIASGTVQALALAILGFLLIGLMVMDWQIYLLPDTFTFSGIAISFFLTCIRAFFLGPTEDQLLLGEHHIRLASPGNVVDHGNVFLTGPENMLGSWFVATVGTALILLAIRWLYKAFRHREGMGLGDVKLLAMIGGFLGFWPALLSLFLGVLLATVCAVFLLARGRAGASTRLAFGSFLSAGALLAALFGTRLIDTYRAFLR